MGKLTLQERILFLILLLAFFLRIIKVGSFPPLYTDEASFGYNAYSILKTGRDEYGQFLPVVLRSFGDYKPALSSYLSIPFVSLFGLNELSTRLPSVILGTLTVLFTYLLTKEIFNKSTIRYPLSAISSFLLAISPWHIHLTRMTMLVGIELFFTTAGIYFFLKGTRTKSYFLLLSAVFFSLGFYAYYGVRLTMPLILVLLFILYRRELVRRKKAVFQAGLLALLILLPLFLTLLKQPEILTARVKWVSLFRYPEVRGKIWQAISLDQGMRFWLVRLLHNKPVFYSKDILRRFLEHFSPEFLIFAGDKAAPFHIWGMGVSYLVLFPFLLLGFVCFFKKFKKDWWLIFFWVLVAPLPASLTAYTPAANRAFGMVVPLQIFTALGLVSFFSTFKKKKLAVLLSLFLILNFVYFLRQYFYVTLRKIPREYRYGQKELIEFVKEKEVNFDKVVASGRATGYIFFLFYQSYSPEKYWQEAEIDTQADDFGFEHVKSFGKCNFRRDFDWFKELKREKILYISYDEEIIEDRPIGYKLVKLIYYPDGKAGIKLIEL